VNTMTIGNYCRGYSSFYHKRTPEISGRIQPNFG
jgi:hypothetical protein